MGSVQKYLLVFIVLLLILMNLTGRYLISKGNMALGSAAIAASIIAILFISFICVKIEHDAGYYECPNCGECHVPKMSQVLWSMHLGTSRKLTCPHCGQKAYHKKVISKNLQNIKEDFLWRILHQF